MTRATGVGRRLRRVLAVVATVSVLAGAGGCGLPSRTDPKLAGPAQSPAAAQGGQKSPPTPADGLGTEQLVESFLQASVGANLGGEGAEPDANKEALERMRRYMAPSKAGSWKPVRRPEGAVVIVRDPKIELVGSGNGQDTVTLALDPLGTLNENGEVSPWTGGPLPKAVFTTVLVGGQRRFQDVPGDYVFISESGLRNWYTQQPIYFWSAGPDNPRLVPDLRYMPSTLSRAKQVNETVHWLRTGPSPLVESVVLKWSVEVKDNPVLEDADVKVNLSGKATAQSKDDLNRLARQIRWSLPDHKPVKLAIETQDAGADSEGYLDDNATVEASQVDQTARYLVVNEAVRSQVVGPGTPENPLFALGGRNQQVVSAAINRQGNRAALVCKVTAQGRTEQRLFVFAPDQSVGGSPRYADSGVAGARLSRPAYITYPVKRLMVSDGSRLWVSRTEDGKEFDAVEPSALGSTAPITAFAVAPEGRRIAFISGRALMVAPLTFDKDGNKFSIGLPVPVATSLGDNQAVGWLTETSLVVGGKPAPRSVHPIGPNNDGPRYNLVAVTIDGAQEEPLPPISRPTDAATDVTELVVRVNRPGFPLDYPVLYEANGVAYRLYSTSSDLLLATSEASPSTAGVSGTAPFIAD